MEKIIHSVEGYKEEEITRKRGSAIIEDGSLKEWKQILKEYGIDKNCMVIVKSKKAGRKIAYTHHSADPIETPHVIVLKTLRKDIINDAFDFLYENFGIKWDDEAEVLRNYLAHVYLHEFYETQVGHEVSGDDRPDSMFDFQAFQRLRKELNEKMIMKVIVFHLAVDSIQRE